MEEKKTIKCPVCLGKKKDCVACKGKGIIPAPKPKNYKKDDDDSCKKAAFILKQQGYTLREIAKILGYNGPQSIKHLLDKYWSKIITQNNHMNQYRNNFDPTPENPFGTTTFKK